MKGITLRESGLVVHPLLPQCPKPPNSFTSRLLSFKLKSLPKKQSFNISSRQQSLLFSRCYRNCVLSACEEWFGDLLHKATERQHGLEHKYVDCKKREETIAVGNKSEDCCVSDHVPVNNNFRSGHYTASDWTVSTTLFNNVLKFMVLFGLLTFQGSLPAVALPDIASGLQSIPYVGDLGDISTGFASAFLLIFFSELGDKTFFIAALLAARNSAVVTFIGTFGALAAMTIVSVVLGRTFHYVDEILPFRFGDTDLPIDDIAAVFLLVYFGVSTLLDASSSDGQKAEDEQKEAELAVSEFSGNGAGILAAANTVISTFFLVFVAEWGDKSFFSTIVFLQSGRLEMRCGDVSELEDYYLITPGSLFSFSRSTGGSLFSSRSHWRCTGWPWCCYSACCFGRIFTWNVLIREGHCLHRWNSLSRLRRCNVV